MRMTAMVSVPMSARHLAEAAPVAARGEEHDQHVLHAPAKHGAHDQPQRSRQVAELRRQRRTDQRPRASDRREVMAEHDPAMRRHEIAAVVEPLAGRGASGVQREHARRDPPAVEAVRDEVDARRGDHEPERVDALAAMERDAAEGRGAGYGERPPNQDLQDSIHGDRHPRSLRGILHTLARPANGATPGRTTGAACRQDCPASRGVICDPEA
jgi:hypothetical protein